jgi:Na+-driven multidrug efflux pump
MVGQSLGAGKPGRAARSVWYAARWNGLLLGVIAVVFVAVPEALIGMFISDPEVIAYGADALRYFGFGYPFFAVGIVMVQGLNGAGDTNTPFVLGILNHWLIQLPLAWWLSQRVGLGPQGLWISVLTADIILAAGGIIAFRAGRWKYRTV